MSRLLAEGRIIVALDVSDLEEAEKLVDALAGHVGAFKVGLQLIMRYGIDRIADVLGNVQLMVDPKLHDIPTTMLKALGQAAMNEESWGVTIHASAGKKAMGELAFAGREHGIETIAVTVLTSHSAEECRHIFGAEPKEVVRRFALDAVAARCTAIVCSPEEVIDLADLDVMRITPGVRPVWAKKNDQQRVTTPRQAVENGADYLVIGRPITQPPEGMTPLQAAQRIVNELR